MRTTYTLRSWVVGALVLTGCVKEVPNITSESYGDPSSDSNSEGGSGPGTSMAATTGAVETGMTQSPTSDASSGEVESSGCGFICDTTGGSTGDKQCDVWKQDCPPTEKCMPYANDGGNSWNATKCTAVDANPGLPGDPCVADGSGTSGIDNCGVGAICWFLDDSNAGTCVPMCTGSAEAPKCENGQVCDESNEGVIILCLDTCDPLQQSCPDGQICFFDGIDTFICDFDASGDGGQYGDPCAFINVCDYGLFCANQGAVPGCPNPDGCCSSYCSLKEPNTCLGAPMQECVPWYEEGAAPPGQEDIGACAVPE